MSKQADPNSELRDFNFKQNDKSYSVNRTADMTVGELIDGIRDKIQRTLESDDSKTDNHNRK